MLAVAWRGHLRAGHATVIAIAPGSGSTPDGLPSKSCDVRSCQSRYPGQLDHSQRCIGGGIGEVPESTSAR